MGFTKMMALRFATGSRRAVAASNEHPRPLAPRPARDLWRDRRRILRDELQAKASFRENTQGSCHDETAPPDASTADALANSAARAPDR